MPLCDVCSQMLEFADGYALTTRQVAAQENYWKTMLDQHSFFDEDLLFQSVRQQAGQRSGWLVCETCSRLFQFNRERAKADARMQRDPQDCGPAKIREVASAAANAWNKKYGEFPAWFPSFRRSTS